MTAPTISKKIKPPKVAQERIDYLLWHFLRPAEFFFTPRDNQAITDNMNWIRSHIWKPLGRQIGQQIGTGYGAANQVDPSTEVVRIMKKFGYSIERIKK